MAQAAITGDMSSSSTDTPPTILVFVQCRDREWYGTGGANDNSRAEAWAFEAAERMLSQGFGVVRVATGNWADVKREHPEWWQAQFFYPGTEQAACHMHHQLHSHSVPNRGESARPSSRVLLRR